MDTHALIQAGERRNEASGQSVNHERTQQRFLSRKVRQRSDAQHDQDQVESYDITRLKCRQDLIPQVGWVAAEVRDRRGVLCYQSS